MSAQSSDHVDEDSKGPPSVIIENLGDVSVASSSAPSRKTVRLQALFPSSKYAFGRINPTSRLMTVLRDSFSLPINFIERLEQLGLNTPAIIVNSFGMDPQSIARTFGLMGSSFVFGDTQEDADLYFAKTALLVTFSRTQICSGHFTKKRNKTWSSLRKSPSYSTSFEEWGSEIAESVQMACTSQELFQQSTKLMQQVRKLLRKWIRNETTASDSSTLPDVQQQSQMSPQPSAETNETFMASLKRFEVELDKKLDAAINEVKRISLSSILDLLENNFN